MKKSLWLALGCLCLLLILVAARYIGSQRPTIVEASYGTISSLIAAQGKVIPYREVDISSEIDGTIARLYVDEGDWVNEGEILLKLRDDRLQAQLGQARSVLEVAKAKLDELRSWPRPEEIEEAKAHLSEAETNLARANSELDRFSKLYQEGIISQAQLDQIKTQAEVAAARYQAAKEHLALLKRGVSREKLAVAEASVRKAEADLAYIEALLKKTIIRAPISGRIINRFFDEGEMVKSGVPVLTIADTSRPLVLAEVDESDVGRLRPHLPVRMTSDSYPGRLFTGRIIEIRPTLGKRTITPDSPIVIVDQKILQIKIALDNLEAQEELKLGVPMDVKIIVAYKEGALIVPKKALQREGRETYLWVWDGKRAVRRRVVIGLSDERDVEILAGIESGTKVLLQPGDYAGTYTQGITRIGRGN